MLVSFYRGRGGVAGMVTGGINGFDAIEGEAR
jgi:hypothetical protein